MMNTWKTTFKVVIDKVGTEVEFKTKSEAEQFAKAHNRKILDTLFQLDLCKNCPIIINKHIKHNRSIENFLKKRCAYADLIVNKNKDIKCKNYLDGEIDLIPIKKIEGVRSES